MTMVERVARAIHTSMDADFPRFTQQTWEQLSGPAKDAMLIRARAAIAAMREPTKEMIKACNGIMGGGFMNSHSDQETWETMIDAALSESAGEGEV